MSPFSQFLHDLRMRRRLRQADLADMLGYEQSYISALEVGLKGPPTNEFLDRLTQVLALSTSERDEMQVASHASQRKLVIDTDAPPDIYWLLADLRSAVGRLSPSQVRIIREVLIMPAVSLEERAEPVRRLKRRKKEEAPQCKNGTNLPACPAGVSMWRHSQVGASSIAIALPSVKPDPLLIPVLSQAYRPARALLRPKTGKSN